MAVTLDINDIVDEYGDYYISQGQNLTRLKSKIYQPSETDKYFKLALTNDTTEQHGYAELDEVLQPYQDAFTAKGDMAFKPVPIPLNPVKIDWEKNPTSLWSSWLGFLASDENDRAQWPFVRYLIEQHILPRRDKDKEEKAIFKGTWAVSAPGTAGAAQDSMDGIRKIIRGWNTASRSNNIVTGALATDPEDFVTQIEDFVAEIPSEVRGSITNVFIDRDLMKRYRAGKRIKYNQNYLQAPDLETIEDESQIKVTGLVSMSGSEMIWTSPADLMIRRQKRSQNLNVFKVESAKRMLSLYTDWFEGVGFLVPELLYHNNRDLS
jgi:hypothetical protein